MTVSTIKAIYTYTIAGVVIVGGFWIMYQTRLEATSSELRLVIAGFIGATIAFLFQQETQTRTAQQTATATAAGVSSTTPQAMTVTSSGPPSATVKVEPAPATEETGP